MRAGRSTGWLAGLGLACLLSLFSPTAVTVAGLVPEREVVQREAVLPAWKLRWDEARDLVRRGRPAAAAVLYEELLAEEANLHEARWELARIRQHLGEPEQALHHFELLREARPENSEYAEELAAALLTAGRFSRAAELFAALLAQAPEDLRRLAGLATVLLEQGKGKEALPHLEKLASQAPDYPGLTAAPAAGETALESLVRLYRQQGLADRARPLVRRLAAPADAAPRLLALAAELHEELGLRRQAAAYWRRLLAAGADHPRAAARLEAYMIAEGQGQEALSYLLPRLAAAPDDPTLLRRSAQVYLGMTRFTEALSHIERYLELYPADRESLLLLLEIYNALERQAEALVTLERLLALTGEVAPDKLLQAAQLFEERGELQRALELYPRIIEQRPDEPPIIARQLRLLDLLGRQEEIRRIMARPERRAQAPEIMAAWQELAPGSREVAVALALAYLEHGRLDQGEELLRQLEQEGFAGVEFLRARALLHEQQGRPYAAWQDYEQFLRQEPQRMEVRRPALALAAELGLLERLAVHRRYLESIEPADFSVALAVAAALIDALDLGGAEAALRALKPAAITPAQQVALLLEQARLFRRAGLFYEAEQALRLALLQQQEQEAIYAALFKLALQEGRPAEAESWLAALRNRLEFHSPAAAARELLAIMQVRLWLAAGSLWQAESLLQEELLSLASPSPEALVLAALISARRGLEPARSAFLDRAWQWAAVDPGRRLELAEILGRYGLHEEVPAVIEPLAAVLPGSLRLDLVQAESLAAGGRPLEALARLEQLLEACPELYLAQARQIELLLQLGRLEEVLELSGRLAAAYPWSTPELLLTRIHALLMQRQWRPALQELEKGLEPPVSALFAAAAAEAQVVVPPDQPPGLWQRLTGAVNPLAGFINTAMSPAYAAGLQPGDERVRRLAAPLYAEYRRQQRLALELQARRAAERREFFVATREFERLAQKYPDSNPVLYDLAGLYSRLERLEPEAVIYRQLADDQVRYPGLAEAIRRNELKRRPRTALHYDYRREEGRDGYKAMVRQRLAASHRLAPSLGHELDLSFSLLHYRDPGNSGSSRGRQAELLYRRDAFAGVDLLLGAGAWSLAGHGDNTWLTRVEIAGDFGDRFWGRLAYRREMVEDTLAAVRQGIRVASYAAEAAIDLLPRLEAGVGYGYLDYSDHNRTQGYDLWAAYTIFTDPTRLKFSYTYDFKDSTHGSPAGGPGATESPYWAPANHWRKILELSFRHQLTDDPFLRDVPRYYTLRYATIYDSEDEVHQVLAAALFLEWPPSLILQVGLEASTASGYRRREISTALTYRW